MLLHHLQADSFDMTVTPHDKKIVDESTYPLPCWVALQVRGDCQKKGQFRVERDQICPLMASSGRTYLIRRGENRAIDAHVPGHDLYVGSAETVLAEQGIFS